MTSTPVANRCVARLIGALALAALFAGLAGCQTTDQVSAGGTKPVAAQAAVNRVQGTAF
jgi:hypothetical protein